MKNKHSMGRKRKRVSIWAITPMVMVVLMGSVGGCRKTITGPRPPDNGNEIDYPFNVSNNATQSYRPRIAIDRDWNVHILWMDGGATEYEKSYIYHREYNPVAGTWSDIDTISDTLGDSWIGGAVSDIYGNIHVVSLEYKSDGRHTYYRELYSDGVWSDIVELTDTPDADQPVIAADSIGGVHVMWWSTHGYLYKYKGPNGEWEWRDTLGTTMENPGLYSKPDGSLVLIISSWNHVRYYEHPPGGRWSPEFIVDTSSGYVNSWWGSAYYDREQGRTMVLWTEGDTSRIQYRYHYDGGGWSQVHELKHYAGSMMPREKRIIKSGGVTYLIWGDGVFKFYMAASSDGELDRENVKVNLLLDPAAPYFDCVKDNEGVLHLVWACEGPDSREDFDVYYTEIQLAR